MGLASWALYFDEDTHSLGWLDHGNGQKGWYSHNLRVKCAEPRCVLPFVVWIALQMVEESGRESHYTTLASCCSQLLGFYVLQDADRYGAEAGRAACRKLCVLYHAFSREAASRGEDLWRPTTNMHNYGFDWLV